MKTRLVAVLLGAAFVMCTACGGGSRHTPSIRTTMTPPQEYRQEENAPNNPGSIFAASDSDTLFSDSRARRVGDIVVVKLVENSKAQHKVETTVDKDNNNNYGVQALFGQSKVGFIPFVGIGPQGRVGANPLMASSSVSDANVTGKTKRENYVTASLATRVVRVLPGGLLQIEGAREIRVNEETEYMVVRGMVRAKDVSADNSILSTQIADASIEYYGKGVISDKQKTGWFSRLMDNVWPF